MNGPVGLPSGPLRVHHSDETSIWCLLMVLPPDPTRRIEVSLFGTTGSEESSLWPECFPEVLGDVFVTNIAWVESIFG